MSITAQVQPNEEKIYETEVIRTPFWIAKIPVKRSSNILKKVLETQSKDGDVQGFLNREFRRIVQFADMLEEAIPDDTLYDESVQAIIVAWMKVKQFKPNQRQSKLPEIDGARVPVEVA